MSRHGRRLPSSRPSTPPRRDDLDRKSIVFRIRSVYPEEARFSWVAGSIPGSSPGTAMTLHDLFRPPEAQNPGANT